MSAGKGMLWMIGASAAYSGVFASVRGASENLPVIEMVFIRAAFGMLFMAPLIWQQRWAAVRMGRPKIYIGRALFSFTGMLAWFYGLSQLPLTAATALVFMAPIFTFVMASVFLGEKAGIRRWAAVIVAFFGVIIILRPGIEIVSLAAVGVLFTSVNYAAVNILTKTLTRSEPLTPVVFHMFFFVFIFSALPTGLYWVPPVASDIPWLLSLGFSSYVAQQCLTRAFAAADTVVVIPFMFLQLPFVAILAFLLFAETPDIWTLVGAVVIFAASWYIARREALQARQRSVGKAP